MWNRHATERRYRPLTLLLQMAILVSGLFGGSGCERHSANRADERPKLVVAVAVNERDRASYQAAVQEFTSANPNVDVELLEIPGNYYEKVLVMIAARNAPDLMWMGQSFQEFAARGVFLDLSGRIAADLDPADFVPEAMEWYRYQGRQYGVAFGIDLKLIVFNKVLFDRAGVDYPHAAWDYELFIERARQLTVDFDGDGRIDQYGFQGELDPSLFNAEIISDDGRRALCNSPQMIDYLQTNLDLAEQHRVSARGRQMVNEAFDNVVSTFRQGKVAMMTMATWNLPEMQERCAEMQWDVVPNPVVRTRGHWASSQAIVVAADTRYPEEAWRLCKVFLSTEFQKGKYPAILPTNVQVQQELTREVGGSAPNVGAMIAASSSLRRLPRIARLNELMQSWYDACDSVWNLRASPADAMARAEREINRTIDAYGRSLP